MTAEFSAGGALGPAPAQRFIYVLEGELDVNDRRKEASSGPGGFAYLPHGTAALRDCLSHRESRGD